LGNWEQQRRELCEVCIEMYQRGLVSAYSGNASLRLEGTGREGLLLVTPTHHPYYRFKPEELGENSLKPSSETRLHLEIYKQRDDVAAVAHTHSIYASVAAVAGREIPPIIDEMIFTLGGSIRIGDYAFPGTQELALVAARALGDRNAALLRNHGAVGVGPNIWEALEVCDLVERLAQIFVLSQAFGPGGGNSLPPDIIELEQQLFQKNRQTSH
jgi:ribulose-5-phosphate 4-epimerase/fuculose-1-phosphate aldolase